MLDKRGPYHRVDPNDFDAISHIKKNPSLTKAATKEQLPNAKPIIDKRSLSLDQDPSSS